MVDPKKHRPASTEWKRQQVEPHVGSEPKAIAAMRQVGYDLSQHVSKGWEDLPAGEFTAVVTMGCGDQCPALNARRREDWSTPDPKNMPVQEFRRVGAEIARKVQVFLASLT